MRIPHGGNNPGTQKELDEYLRNLPSVEGHSLFRVLINWMMIWALFCLAAGQMPFTSVIGLGIKIWGWL